MYRGHLTAGAKCVSGRLTTAVFHLLHWGPRSSSYKMQHSRGCTIATWWLVHWSIIQQLFTVAGVGVEVWLREEGTRGSRVKMGKYWTGPYFIWTFVCCCCHLLRKLETKTSEPMSAISYPCANPEMSARASLIAESWKVTQRESESL